MDTLGGQSNFCPSDEARGEDPVVDVLSESSRRQPSDVWIMIFFSWHALYHFGILVRSTSTEWSYELNTSW